MRPSHARNHPFAAWRFPHSSSDRSSQSEASTIKRSSGFLIDDTRSAHKGVEEQPLPSDLPHDVASCQSVAAPPLTLDSDLATGSSTSAPVAVSGGESESSQPPQPAATDGDVFADSSLPSASLEQATLAHTEADMENYSAEIISAAIHEQHQGAARPLACPFAL